MRKLLRAQGSVINELFDEYMTLSDFITPLMMGLMRLDKPLKHPMGYGGINAGNWYYHGKNN